MRQALNVIDHGFDNPAGLGEVSFGDQDVDHVPRQGFA